MPSPRITAGERRGLIILLIVIIIATVMLCRRDRPWTHGTPADTTALTPSDTLQRISRPDSAPISTRKHRKSRASKQAPARPASTAPRPRSPRDEQVN